MKHGFNQLNNVSLKFSLIVCLLIYGTTFSQETKNESNVGVITFETSEIDYGTINQNADGERIFKFTNTGDSPLVITQVKTSCGCTVPSYSRTPVLPSESGEIKIKYATNRIGAFKKTITVISNASEPNKILYIKGNVLKPVN